MKNPYNLYTKEEKFNFLPRFSPFCSGLGFTDEDETGTENENSVWSVKTVVLILTMK